MLNFESAQFVDPKIQIAPRELPVEEMMKVGNVLQDRFDKAMENETKTQAFIRKLKSSSNPADHAVADQIMSNYNQRIKDRATNGRYQDMQWQTQQDALDVAGMYEGLSNRAKQIAEYEKAIDLNPKVSDPKVKQHLKEQYRKNITQAQFDSEKRMLQGLDVSAPNIVNDFDYGKWAMDNAGQWKPSTIAGKKVEQKFYKPGARLPDGTTSEGGVYRTVGSSSVQKVTDEEIKQGLEKIAFSNPDLQAALERDKQVYGDNIAYKNLNNAIKSAADAHSFSNIVTDKESVYDQAATARYGYGYGNEAFNPDLHFNAVVSQIDLDKSVEDVRNNQAKIASANFDANGNFKKSSLLDNEGHILKHGNNKKNHTIFDKIELDENGHIVKEEKNTNQVPEYSSLNQIVPDWQIKRIRDQHPGYTDKQVFDDFSNQKADAAKLLLKKYNVSSKEMAGVVDANTKRLLTTLPFKVKDGNEDRDATEDEIQQALKDGQVSYIPASGQTVVNSKGLKLISALGEQGKSIDANPYQVRMSQMKQMLQSALDPSVNFETSIGKFEMPEPVRQPDGSLQNEMTHFRMIKKGDVATDENGKKYYVNSDQIQQVTPEGKIVNRYGLDSEGLNKFVNHI